MIYTYNHNLMCQYVLVFLCTVAMYLIPDGAFAQTPTITGTLGASICELINMMTGMVGRSIATLAVMFIGIGSFFGKANWGLVITVAVGISLIFGAAAIAEAIGVTGAGSVCAAASAPSLLDQKISFGLCKIASAIAGPTGSGLASLAVVFVGLACFFGKASWQNVITTTAGIALLFGSGTIIKSVFASGGWVTVGSNNCLPTLL